MILDLEQTAPPDVVYDVCVVGGGAAGIALASELDGSGLHVLLCEAGGLDHEPRTQDLYGSDVSGLGFVGVHEGRFRVFGGSTTRWGGQALPLTPRDFEVRDWVPYSGWPIDYETLRPYYARALAFLGLDATDFDDELYILLGRSRAALDRVRFWHHFSAWSPAPDLRRRHGSRLTASSDVTLLLHANLTLLRLKQSLDAVESAIFRSLDGQITTVVAREFVLCVGGIETARVLLSNRTQFAAGIGNGRDLVGRFFQDHPAARVGKVRPTDARQFQRLFNVSQKRGQRYSSRITATFQLQQSLHLLNTSAFFNFDAPENSGIQRLKRAYIAIRRDRRIAAGVADLWAAAWRPSESLYPLWRFTAFGEVYTPAKEYGLTVICEQEPSPESRILLSPRVDALGVPRSDVRWQISESVRTTVRAFATLLRDELSRANLANLEFDHPVMTDASDWRDSMNDQYHQLGTARMGRTPEEGVVDTDLRVHGVQNLSIASGAVFPTGGHSNPTLTILALTFRLADRLRSAPRPR
jgi:choline dehydrogenase-like flavoprotein